MTGTWKRWMAWVLCAAMLCPLAGTVRAVDDEVGLAYSVSVETFDDNDAPKSTFQTGDTVVAKVMLRSTGSASAPIYAVQGRVKYGAGLDHSKHTAAAGLEATEEVTDTRELAFAGVSTTGLSPDYPAALLTITFQAETNGKPTLALSDVIVANADATPRSVTVLERTQITIGTGERPATTEALEDDIHVAQVLLDSAVVSNTEISAYSPAFRVTLEVYHRLSQQIASAKAALDEGNDIATAMATLAAAVKEFEDNRIYRYPPTPGGGSTSRPQVTVAVSSGAGGTASLGGGVSQVYQGTSLTITATPDEGYEVLSIYVNGARFPGQERYTISNVSHATQVHVEFCPTPPFTDLAETAWYYDAARYTWAKGLLVGTGGDSFSPAVVSTRGMLVTILHRLEGEPAAAPAPFLDVADTNYYAQAVAWAVEHGIVLGDGAGRFLPDGEITREQTAAILYRYAAYRQFQTGGGTELDGFVDVARVSPYAEAAIRWAVANGIITGKDGDRLDPGGTTTRAELAAILLRFVENIAQ